MLINHKHTLAMQRDHDAPMKHCLAGVTTTMNNKWRTHSKWTNVRSRKLRALELCCTINDNATFQKFVQHKAALLIVQIMPDSLRIIEMTNILCETA